MGGEETVLVIGNLKVGEGLARVVEREIYVDLRTVREHIDPHIYWDELEQTAIITTAERVIHMRSEKVASEINLRPVELEFPPCAGMRRDASFYRCCFWRIFMA